MLPADEGFDPVDATAAAIPDGDDRLVVQAEFLLPDAAHDLGFEIELEEVARVTLGMEEGHSCPAPFLDVGEREARFAIQIRDGVLGATAGDDTADRRRHSQAAAIDRGQGDGPAEQALRHDLGVEVSLRLAEHDGEFVGAHSCHEVRLTHRIGDTLADVDEQRVGLVVAEVVVDDLEAVDVQDEQRELITRVPTQAGDLGFEALVEGGAIGEPGQRVTRHGARACPGGRSVRVGRRRACHRPYVAGQRADDGFGRDDFGLGRCEGGTTSERVAQGTPSFGRWCTDVDHHEARVGRNVEVAFAQVAERDDDDVRIPREHERRGLDEGVDGVLTGHHDRCGTQAIEPGTGEAAFEIVTVDRHLDHEFGTRGEIGECYRDLIAGGRKIEHTL